MQKVVNDTIHKFSIFKKIKMCKTDYVKRALSIIINQSFTKEV